MGNRESNSSLEAEFPGLPGPARKAPRRLLELEFPEAPISQLSAVVCSEQPSFCQKCESAPLQLYTGYRATGALAAGVPALRYDSNGARSVRRLGCAALVSACTLRPSRGGSQPWRSPARRPGPRCSFLHRGLLYEASLSAGVSLLYICS